jgi:hypothetical protein
MRDHDRLVTLRGPVARGLRLVGVLDPRAFAHVRETRGEEVLAPCGGALDLAEDHDPSANDAGELDRDRFPVLRRERLERKLVLLRPVLAVVPARLIRVDVLASREDP